MGLRMEIPSTHWSIGFRGKSGAGKTTLIPRVIKRLAEENDLGVIVVCSSKLKQPETYGVYDSVLGKGNYKKYKGVTYAMIRKMRDHVLVIEDAPMYMGSNKRRHKCVKDLVTAIARAHRVFTVLVAQTSIRVSLPINVRLVLNGSNYQYRVIEARRSTPWYDWTNSFDDVDPVLDAIYNGVEGDELGDVGRPVDTTSMKQRIEALFDKGMSPKEINKEYGYKSQSKEYIAVYSYYSRWKAKGEKKC